MTSLAFLLFKNPEPPTLTFISNAVTAVLSTTAKAKAWEQMKEKEKAATSGEAMDTVSLFALVGLLIIRSRHPACSQGQAN